MKHILLLITMDGQRRPAILTKVFRDVISDTFCAHEYENLRILGTDLIQVLDQLRALLEITANLHKLFDVVVRSEFHRPNVDLDHIFQEILEAQ